MADLLALAERQPKIAWGTLARALGPTCLADRSMACIEVIIPEQLSEAPGPSA